VSASDPIPAGFITLYDAFVRFECERFEGDPPWALTDPPDSRDLVRLEELAEADSIGSYFERAKLELFAGFTKQELKAFVRPRNSSRNHQLGSWHDIPIATVPFLAPAINVPAGHRWEKNNGLLAFVNEAELEEWLKSRVGKFPKRSRWVPPSARPALKTRVRLVNLVHQGAIVPEEAEQFAKVAGIPPLAGQTNPAASDSFREPFWTLPMALAWISDRNNNAVNERCDDFWASYYSWESTAPEVSDGSTVWRLQAGMPATVRKLVRSKVRYRSARHELWHALQQEKKLEAIGTDLETGKRVVIPGYLWATLDYVVEGEKPICRSNSSKEQFAGVLVSSIVVRELWPEQQKKQAQTPVPSASAVSVSTSQSTRLDRTPIAARRETRKPYNKWDWTAIETEIRRLLDQNGTINASIEPQWTTAQLRKEIESWCRKNWQAAPSRSQLHKKISTMLASVDMSNI